ncbi:MAG: hypothetical protein JSW02_02850, partial [candidate division WOR-3 bacterium]
PGLAFCKICARTGLLATSFCPEIHETLFTVGTEPVDSCDLHQIRSPFGYQDDFETLQPEPEDNF